MFVFAAPRKNKSVARHRVIHTRAGKDKTVVATESGNHDRDGHGKRARASKNGAHRRDGDAILRCVLDFGKRERREVSDVSQDVEDNDDRRNRRATTRGRLLPGSRTSLPIKVTFVQAVCAKSGPTIALPTRPRSRARRRRSGRVARLAGSSHSPMDPTNLRKARRSSDFQPNERPMTMSAMSAAVFAKVKMFCTSLPMLEPARVCPGQQEDQSDGDQLLGRKTDRVATADESAR